MSTDEKLDNESANRGCAIIVGAGPGLGRALALRFAAGGYNIALVSRNKDKTQGLAAEIKSTYSKVNVLTVSADSTKSAECRNAFDQIIEKSSNLGPVDVLCLNAANLGFSGWPPPSFLDAKLDEFEIALNVGVRGMFIWSQLVLPAMIKNDNLTSILITGATASLRGSAKFGTFAAPKFAIRALSQSIAREFGPKGVHVAHIIIDGTILRLKTKESNDAKTNFVNPNNADPEKQINPNQIANTYYFISQQDKSCWTQEMDLRPGVEKW